MERHYYEAYDDRYRQVHGAGLQWEFPKPTPIVGAVMEKFGIEKNAKILEVGCGEGRDALDLLGQGYNVLATDIAPQAISWCREKAPKFAEHFQVLDCLHGERNGQFDFIYGIAVLHMLVLDDDRRAFYRFFREHLGKRGIGLICTMGDGKAEICSDPSEAFLLKDRTHQETGKVLKIAGTSCRMVSFSSMEAELQGSGLIILETGVTNAEPNFSELMYAVVRR